MGRLKRRSPTKEMRQKEVIKVIGRKRFNEIESDLKKAGASIYGLSPVSNIRIGGSCYE